MAAPGDDNNYAFDVKPVNGQMGCVVVCPICGTNGTAHANEIIARSMLATSENNTPGRPVNASLAAMNFTSPNPIASRGIVPPDSPPLHIRRVACGPCPENQFAFP
jgi:hypothetical protein